jgi:hypothetical protein
MGCANAPIWIQSNYAVVRLSAPPHFSVSHQLQLLQIDPSTRYFGDQIVDESRASNQHEF